MIIEKNLVTIEWKIILNYTYIIYLINLKTKFIDFIKNKFPSIHHTPEIRSSHSIKQELSVFCAVLCLVISTFVLINIDPQTILGNEILKAHLDRFKWSPFWHFVTKCFLETII